MHLYIFTQGAIDHIRAKKMRRRDRGSGQGSDQRCLSGGGSRLLDPSPARRPTPPWSCSRRRCRCLRPWPPPRTGRSTASGHILASAADSSDVFCCQRDVPNRSPAITLSMSGGLIFSSADITTELESGRSIHGTVFMPWW